MRAVRVTAWNTDLRIDDVPVPERRPGHTLVQVEAATVGHIDRTIWSGQFLRHPPLPYTPGVEAAGTVIESDSFAAGERVWIRGGGLGTATDGTWAEIVAAPDTAIGRLPADVAFDVGAAFFSPCTSAWVSVHSIGGLQAGQRVIVTGATGAVGSIVVQLALDIGADVIATVSRPERRTVLPPGVDAVVVDGREPIDGFEADLLIDTVGGRVLPTVLPWVKPGGHAVLVGYLAGPTVELDLPAFMQRDVSLHPLNMIRREAEGRAAAAELLDRLGDGRITLEVTAFPLDDASVALDWLADPGHLGRAVLLPGPGTGRLHRTPGSTGGDTP